LKANASTSLRLSEKTFQAVFCSVLGSVYLGPLHRGYSLKEASNQDEAVAPFRRGTLGRISSDAPMKAKVADSTAFVVPIGAALFY
jgi:hypothetical protein